MCQQSIEKLVKGLYVLYTNEEPPRTHNIWAVFGKIFNEGTYRSKIADLEFEKKLVGYKPFFAELVAYYISERYPSYREKLSASVKKEKAGKILFKTEEVFLWLKSLKKYFK